jgi:4,5-dihydroxyphthalate decarboxylase
VTRPLRLTLAVGDYDITRPLLDGQVSPAGVDLVALTAPSPQRHWRMLVHREFDIAEMSLGSYVARRSSGDDSLVAVPAFPHRRFRHGYAFVSTARGITRPEELAGETVGVRSWQTTAGVWLRGILEEHHGLPTQSVRWLAQDAEDVPLSLPPGLDLTPVPAGRAVTTMCADGEIAGLIYPELPEQVLAGDGTIRPVFDHPKAVEQEYFRTTGIFPIMHVVVIRAELLESFPWLARSVYDAFVESKRLAMKRLSNPRTVSLAWLLALQQEERELLGPDPWHYGFDDVNAHTLATFLRYAHDQGVAAREMTAEELFFPALLEQPPAYV